MSRDQVQYFNIEIDPDGLIEDRNDVLNTNLKQKHSYPQLLKGSNDISFRPPLLVLNIYNFC